MAAVSLVIRASECLTNSCILVFTPGHCLNLKAMSYELANLNRIFDHESPTPFGIALCNPSLKANFHLRRDDLAMRLIEKKFRCNWRVIGAEYFKSSLWLELRTEWKLALRPMRTF